MAFRLQQTKLPSGLQTVLLPREEGQSVTMLVLVGVGSRYETPRQSGLSHFLEHMFFKGTEKRPTTKEIAEAVDAVGGEFNAFTSEEYTGYYVKVAASHLERAVDVVSDILLRPLFPAEEIERERGVITEEIRMYTDTPMRHIWHLWNEALYGQHPLGRRIDGSPETVAALQRRDFLNYTAEHYNSGNTVVVVSGRFETKQIKPLLKKSFVDLKKGSTTKPKPAPATVPKQKVVLESRPSLDQTHLMVGVPGLAWGDKDKTAADLLALILGGGMSSRLFLSVRERNGLAYAVRTFSENFTDTGSFVTQAGVRTDKAVAATKLILAEYDRVISEPIQPAELKKAKQMARGSLLLGLEETNSLGIFAGTQQLLEGKVKKPNEILREVEAVTAADIKRVAQKILAPRKRALAILGPQKSAKAFENCL